MRGIPAGSDGVADGGQGTFVVRWSSGLALTGVQKATMVMAAVGLLSASAYLSVPFFPVPLTMQTLAVLLIGGMLGPVLGASAVAGYIALGAAGAPVFHNGLAGPAVLAGPTGGYLIGFIAAAFVMGIAVQWATQIGRRGDAGPGDGDGGGADGSGQRASLTGWTSLVMLAAGVLVASAAVYLVGVPWLALFTGGDLGAAVSAGAVPFLLGDLLKGAVAIAAMRAGGEVLARRGLLLP
jgi:biotin transport system substrate-specific component